jgi:hypothetical protein
MGTEEYDQEQRAVPPPDLFETISRLYDEILHPFPYADCRKIQAQFKNAPDGLIPDLDVYFADLAGYCSRGNRIIRMSTQEFLNVKKVASQSFFEKHPEYECIRSFVSEKNSPTLFRDLNYCEEIRAAFLKICELCSVNFK